MSIDEPIDMTDAGEDEIKKRRPKPFRYVANDLDIQKELASDEVTHFTVMKAPGEAKVTINEGRLTSLENAQKIEDVIKRHEEIRRHNLENTEGYSIN